ncbi:MAG: helix-turn-helix transcriptional regulator [Terrimicrobiaceae bacterium]|nr:helix-turn-helix transcriptional regulator [Terrimicrobiaceae bacterium]
MSNAPRNIVGPQVRRLRVALEISQPELAGRCQRLGWDVGRDAIAKIEGGSRWVADCELVYLARALECSLLELFAESVQRQLAVEPRKRPA